MSPDAPTRRRPRVRPMQMRDLHRVAAIESVCFGPEAWPPQVFRDVLEAFIQAQPMRGGMWVAEDPDTREVVGYAGVEVSALWGEMDLINIAVAPAQRRRGAGQALVKWIIRVCRREGIPLLWLRVRASNEGARRFYDRLGFEQRGHFDHYYEDPDEPAVVMAMDVSLPPSESRPQE
jgi:ribosomal-protein-alanine acetyltransferase